ncbi:MAG: DUF3368 domain-containing protein [Lewinellaceae bacterium]|nr:DUF3368 domain-containing protein [Lewinellaceae bacterium]
MPEKIIIADSSCLIALSNIGELQILQQVYQQITITPEIENEFGEAILDWIIIEEVTDKKKIEILELELDKGESSAIALAIEKENSLLEIDEKKGRNVAKKMGIKITGILGVIIKAKEIGLIKKITPLIEKLEKVDFRISKTLKEKILRRVGEL